jgi:hypothetical protein
MFPRGAKAVYCIIDKGKAYKPLKISCFLPYIVDIPHFSKPLGNAITTYVYVIALVVNKVA